MSYKVASLLAFSTPEATVTGDGRVFLVSALVSLGSVEILFGRACCCFNPIPDRPPEIISDHNPSSPRGSISHASRSGGPLQSAVLAVLPFLGTESRVTPPRARLAREFTGLLFLPEASTNPFRKFGDIGLSCGVFASLSVDSPAKERKLPEFLFCASVLAATSDGCSKPKPDTF